MGVKLQTIIKDVDNFNASQETIELNNTLSTLTTDWDVDKIVKRSVSLNTAAAAAFVLDIFEGIVDPNTVTGIFITCNTAIQDPTTISKGVAFDVTFTSGAVNTFIIHASEFSMLKTTTLPEAITIQNLDVVDDADLAILNIFVFCTN